LELSLLPKRGKIYEVRKIIYEFVHYVFHLDHKYPKHVDYVKWDYERLIRYLLSEYCLEEVAANNGGVKICLTGDGAEIAGNESDSQCAVGYKLTDERACDPISGNLVFVKEVDQNRRI